MYIILTCTRYIYTPVTLTMTKVRKEDGGQFNGKGGRGQVVIIGRDQISSYSTVESLTSAKKSNAGKNQLSRTS